MAKIDDRRGRLREDDTSPLGRLHAKVDKTKLVVDPITPASNSIKCSVRPSAMS